MDATEGIIRSYAINANGLTLATAARGSAPDAPGPRRLHGSSSATDAPSEARRFWTPVVAHAWTWRPTTPEGGDPGISTQEAAIAQETTAVTRDEIDSTTGDLDRDPRPSHDHVATTGDAAAAEDLDLAATLETERGEGDLSMICRVTS